MAAPSPSPSPYAPGIISEERVPPRPAGRPVVFVLATLVMTLVTTTSFWWGWARRSTLVSGHARSMLNLFSRAAWVSGLLILVWAYLSDRVSLWGTRREGYLLLCSLTMAITWVVLAVLGTQDIAWLLAAVEFGVATSVARAAVTGGLAEIGQRRAATGRLAASNVIAARMAVLAAAPLAAVFGFAPLPVTAGIAAALQAGLVILIITLSDDGTRPADGPAITPVTIPQFLRSRTFWSVVAFLFVAGLATVPPEPLASRVWATQAGGVRALSVKLRWIHGAATVLGAVAYLFLCRRAALRTLLRIGLFAGAVVLIAFERTLQSGSQGAVDIAVAAIAACDGIVIVACFDLVLRAAPHGREAFGAILMGGFPVFAGSLVSSFADTLEASASGAVWFAASAAIAAALAVSLLPRPLVTTRDGERAPV
jgi:hypothetical protein